MGTDAADATRTAPKPRFLTVSGQFFPQGKAARRQMPNSGLARQHDAAPPIHGGAASMTSPSFLICFAYGKENCRANLDGLTSRMENGISMTGK